MASTTLNEKVSAADTYVNETTSSREFCLLQAWLYLLLFLVPIALLRGIQYVLHLFRFPRRSQ